MLYICCLFKIRFIKFSKSHSLVLIVSYTEKMNPSYPAQPNYSGQPPNMSDSPGYGGQRPYGGGADPYGQPGPGVYTNNTIEADAFLGDSQTFSDIRIRHAFIRKVYGILSFQLFVTIAIGSIIRFVPACNKFFMTNPGILWFFIIGTFVIMIALVCCESVSRKFPLNMILLFVFTVFESFLVGCISSVYNLDTVIIAMGITAAVVVAVTIFAFQTKYDFTGFGVYLMVFVLILFIFGIISIFIRSKIIEIIYASLGAGIFSMYIIFDTQLMLGGKHKYSISPEDYILAALNIYIDIINLFLMILRLVSSAKD